jgi:hypothetical protein
MKNLNCINCGSDTTRKVSSVYAEGAHILSGQTTSGGVGIGFTSSGPVLGSGAAGGSFSGTISSNLSQQLSPPLKISYWSIIKIGFVVVLLGQISLALFVSEKVSEYFVMTWTLIIAISFIYSIYYNFRVYPVEFKEWNKLFYCSKCDTIFEPE